MGLFHTEIKYQIDAKGRNLKEIFSPWLKKQKLAGWRQVLSVQFIFNENKILFQRAGEKSMIANDVIFTLYENELTIAIKTRKEQFFPAVIFFLIFFGAAFLKGFAWKPLAMSILSGVVLLSVLTFSVHYEKTQVKKDIWQELHLQKIKFKEIK